MKRFLTRLRGLWRDQSAVSAVTIALLIPVMIGMTGFVIDIGHVAVVQQQLQAATDAAALAGGYNIPTNTAVSTANSYSTTNAPSGVTATMVSGYPVLKCFTSTGVTCAGTELSGGANAIQVSERATVPLWFSEIFGLTSFSTTATSTAGARGGVGEALNVMIVLDTTASMSSSTDNNCGLGSSSSREACALAGVKTLLTNLNPSLDYVGIMAFPGLQTASEASKDYTCGQSIGSSGTQTYSNAPVYQIVGLSNDFKSSSTATTLSTSSHLSLAVNAGGTGCSSGVSAPGGQQTYYAGAINAAQAALTALSSSQTPPSQNVIIFLSDGGANSSSTQISFSGWVGTCTTSRGHTTCSSSRTLTVTSCSGCSTSTTTSQQGPLAVGDVITGTGIAAGTTITALGTGSGGTGSYTISSSQSVGSNTSSESMVAAQALTMNGYNFSENIDQCQQAIAAAQAAAKAGTWVYSIAYGSSTATGSGNSGSDCTSDSTTIVSGLPSPHGVYLSSCTAMQYIANSQGNYPDSGKFFSNNNNGVDCPNSNTIENLNTLFQTLSTNLTEPRLLPNNTT
jgi:Flp pilus assembly protein TadG